MNMMQEMYDLDFEIGKILKRSIKIALVVVAVIVTVALVMR